MDRPRDVHGANPPSLSRGTEYEPREIAAHEAIVSTKAAMRKKLEL